MNVLYSSFSVTLKTLHDKIGIVARDLQKEAAQQDLLVTGPVYWFYFGLDGNPDTVFTLQVAIPVSGKPVTKENMLYAELPEFKCLATTHSGSWSRFTETYGKLIQRISADGLQPVGMSREVYLNIDFEHADNNITEIQIGIR
jgi:effector-binding domain-containing protein